MQVLILPPKLSCLGWESALNLSFFTCYLSCCVFWMVSVCPSDPFLTVYALLSAWEGWPTWEAPVGEQREGGEKVRSPKAPSLHLNLRSQTCQAALPTEPSLPLGSCDCFLLSFLHTKWWVGRKPGIPSAGALHYFLWYPYTQLTPLQIVY